MAEVNDMFDSVTKEQSFFVPGKKKKKEWTAFAKGVYLGHIIKCDSKIVDVKKGEYKARLYTYTFEVAEDNKRLEFEFRDISGEKEKTMGDAYIGCKFLGKVWRFLEPGEKDTFKSYSEGNAGYLRFCETIGLKCPIEVRNINGEDVEIQLLPELSPSDMLGKACKAQVDKGRPWINKDGERKQYWDAKYVMKWDSGEDKVISEADSDEIPF